MFSSLGNDFPSKLSSPLTYSNLTEQRKPYGLGQGLLFSFHIKTDSPPPPHKYFYFKGLGPVCFGPFCENLSRLRGIFTICMNLCNFNLDRDKLLLPIKAGNFICSSEHRVYVLPWP